MKTSIVKRHCPKGLSDVIGAQYSCTYIHKKCGSMIKNKLI